MEHLAEYLTFSPSPTQMVTTSVTRRQARQALLLKGLLDKVQPVIDLVIDPIERRLAQISWDDSLEFKRDDPFLLKMEVALNLTDSDIDELFALAASL